NGGLDLTGGRVWVRVVGQGGVLAVPQVYRGVNLAVGRRRVRVVGHDGRLAVAQLDRLANLPVRVGRVHVPGHRDRGAVGQRDERVQPSAGVPVLQAHPDVLGPRDRLDLEPEALQVRDGLG